jgi:hypothetical protein
VRHTRCIPFTLRRSALLSSFRGCWASVSFTQFSTTGNAEEPKPARVDNRRFALLMLAPISHVKDTSLCVVAYVLPSQKGNT